jgi:hypothetical protein
MNIFLDDERLPKDVKWIELPLVEWTISRNYYDFVKLVQNEWPKIISFDHDLGPKSYNELFKNNMQSFNYDNLNGEKTGYDCLRFLIGKAVELNRVLPEIYIHTMNPIGRDNMMALIANYNKHIKQ